MCRADGVLCSGLGVLAVGMRVHGRCASRACVQTALRALVTRLCTEDDTVTGIVSRAVTPCSLCQTTPSAAHGPWCVPASVSFLLLCHALHMAPLPSLNLSHAPLPRVAVPTPHTVHVLSLIDVLRVAGGGRCTSGRLAPCIWSVSWACPFATQRPASCRSCTVDDTDVSCRVCRRLRWSRALCVRHRTATATATATVGQFTVGQFTHPRLSLLSQCVQQRPPGVRLPAVPVRADGAASARRRVHRNPASGRCGTASSPLS
jgi:hypothetical protein